MKHYSVWVDGTEVHDYYVNYNNAVLIAQDYKYEGYTPIIRNYLTGEETLA